MDKLFSRYNLVVLFFAIISVFFVFYFQHKPIGDFGNYYYGSKLLAEGSFSKEMYTSIDYFNKQILAHGEQQFFENYIPVPPFNALFYLPFTILSGFWAKLIFNIISIIVFCFSINQLIKFFNLNSIALVLLPFVFIPALLSNVIQGQSYLLIISMLIEAFVLSEKGKTHIPAILMALVISLKLFPAFILLYFLLNQKYKVVLWSIIYFLCLQLLTMFFISPDIVFYYFSEIVPRLLNNDVVGAYHYTNQSVYSFLLNIFSYDEINNPSPFINAPVVVPIVEALCSGLVITVLISKIKEGSSQLFGFSLFAMLLVLRYNTSYATILLLPFLMLITQKLELKRVLLMLILVALALYITIFNSGSEAIVIKFFRLLMLLLVFVYMMFSIKSNFSVKTFVVICVPILLLKICTFQSEPINYFKWQNTKGILCNYEIKSDSLVLVSTLGDNHYSETVKVAGKMKQDEQLRIEGKKVIFNNREVFCSNDNKQTPFLYNDSLIVLMSDLNQGVGFYKLRVVSIK